MKNKIKETWLCKINKNPKKTLSNTMMIKQKIFMRKLALKLKKLTDQDKKNKKS